MNTYIVRRTHRHSNDYEVCERFVSDLDEYPFYPIASCDSFDDAKKIRDALTKATK